MSFQQFRNVSLHPIADAMVNLDIKSLLAICHPGMGIPQDIIEKTNLCWVNVLFMVARLFGKKINKKIANKVFIRIKKANSCMMSPTDMPELVDALKLPVTLVEYSMTDNTGWSFGPTVGGNTVFLCNTGMHYQIFVRADANLVKLGMVMHPSTYKPFRVTNKSMCLEKAIESQNRMINLALVNQLKARNQQELDDSALARDLNARNQQELDDSALARDLNARQLKARNQQELDDSALARDLNARQLKARNQQELDDSALARKLSRQLKARNQQELDDSALARKLSRQ
jgi:hypothetical protein